MSRYKKLFALKGKKDKKGLSKSFSFIQKSTCKVWIRSYHMRQSSIQFTVTFMLNIYNFVSCQRNNNMKMFSWFCSVIFIEFDNENANKLPIKSSDFKRWIKSINQKFFSQYSVNQNESVIKSYFFNTFFFKLCQLSMCWCNIQKSHQKYYMQRCK